VKPQYITLASVLYAVRSVRPGAPMHLAAISSPHRNTHRTQLMPALRDPK
jgi:hypothetical protein